MEKGARGSTNLFQNVIEIAVSNVKEKLKAELQAQLKKELQKQHEELLSAMRSCSRQ